MNQWWNKHWITSRCGRAEPETKRAVASTSITMEKLLAVYKAADVALHSDVIGSNSENIERLAEVVAAVHDEQKSGGASIS